MMLICAADSKLTLSWPMQWSSSAPLGYSQLQAMTASQMSLELLSTYDSTEVVLHARSPANDSASKAIGEAERAERGMAVIYISRAGDPSRG